ncbi:MAG: sirohydrochlorin cobaltochelatase [Brevinema sp.]
MNKALFLIHYGTKTIFSDDTLYQDFEAKAKFLYPDADIFTIYCSEFLQKMIREQKRDFLLLEDIISLGKKYQEIICIPTYLTSGSEWSKVLRFISSHFPHAMINEPFLESQTEAIIECIDHLLKQQDNCDYLLVGHGGEGSQTNSYFQIYQALKTQYPHLFLILSEESNDHQQILAQLQHENCYLLPLRFSSSPYSTKKMIEQISPYLPHKHIHFLWDRLGDLELINKVILS